MANRTDPEAKNIRGTNPQNLVEKIVRSKIYEHTYWKEQCFGLTAETLVDKAIELDHLGGANGGTRKPTPFMCLVLKMLQIQPEKDIVVEFIKNEAFGYVRVLGAFYLRLTGTDIDVYRYLEPLYNDNQRLRQKQPDGSFTWTHMDEVIDELLTKDYSCDIALPRIKKRWTLETLAALGPRKSALEDDFEEELEREENEQLDRLDNVADEQDYYHERSAARDRDRDRDRKRDGHRHRHRDYDRDYDRERGHRKERDRDRDRDRDLYLSRDERYYGRQREREKEREGRERERRDRDRGRRRSHSRSRSSGRDRKRQALSSSPNRCGNGAEEPKKKQKKEKKDDGTNHPDPEIAEANKLRASLGLKPLK